MPTPRLFSIACLKPDALLICDVTASEDLLVAVIMGARIGCAWRDAVVVPTLARVHVGISSPAES